MVRGSSVIPIFSGDGIMPRVLSHPPCLWGALAHFPFKPAFPQSESKVSLIQTSVFYNSLYTIGSILFPMPSFMSPKLLLFPTMLIGYVPEECPSILEFTHLLSFSLTLIFWIWWKWGIGRIILYGMLNDCNAQSRWPFGIWLCTSCSTLGAWTLLQEGEGERWPQAFHLLSSKSSSISGRQTIKNI